MGNCAMIRTRRSPPPLKPKAALSTEEIAETPLVRLYGSDSCAIACRIRVALLYKRTSFQFCPSANSILGRPVLFYGSDNVTGSAEEMLRYVDEKFPGPPDVEAGGGGGVAEKEAAAVAVAALQHRSMEQHLEGMVKWAGNLAAGGKEVGKGKRLEKCYAMLVEVMLEHAQMEERILFPVLDAAAHGPGVCMVANEEHARDLPIMNGIKEDIKSLMAMAAGSPCYRETLDNLHRRLKTLQKHCKEHFKAEERELLPLLADAERTRFENGEEPRRWVAEMVGLMEITHSRLFHFFMAGLLPQEAMQYLALVCKLPTDQDRVVGMLRSLISWMEGASSPSIICHFPIRSV